MNIINNKLVDKLINKLKERTFWIKWKWKFGGKKDEKTGRLADRKSSKKKTRPTGGNPDGKQ